MIGQQGTRLWGVFWGRLGRDNHLYGLCLGLELIKKAREKVVEGWVEARSIKR